MTPRPDMPIDPIARLAFQPVVDLARLRPRRAALGLGDMFLATAATLTAVRAATMDWTATPGLLATLAMAVTGALTMWAVMRFGAAVGPGVLTGPLAAVHLGVRLLFVYCVLADVVQVAALVSSEERVAGASLLRALLQLCQSAMGLSSLYLAICAEPPPPPPPRRFSPAHA